MRQLLLAALGLVAVCLAAACTPKPVTDSEFRGFCYTSGGGRHASCDTISLCNTYDSQVLSFKYPSAQACNAACEATYNALSGPNQFNGCMPTVVSGYNWCTRYCNTNFQGTSAP
ncbi:hypothetical protein [Solidesulfovibrio sp.]